MNPNNQVAIPETVQSPEAFNAFGSISMFESAQRMAKALCSSSIVPETYRGEGKLGDCIIALEISNRIGATVLAVMQNLYIVHGRPAWSSQFLISCVNASRRFSPLRYKMTGTVGQDDWGCVAWATDNTAERLESPEVTIAMAKAEGWYGRSGSKWKTIPELMLRYRAATFFTRLYAPELTMGIQSDDEVIDIKADIITEPLKTTKPMFATPTTAVAIAEKSTLKPDSKKGELHIVKAVRGLIKLANIDEGAFLGFMRTTSGWDDSLGSLEEVMTVAPSKIEDVYNNWDATLTAYNSALKGLAK